jgi:hypothetical protein
MNVLYVGLTMVTFGVLLLTAYFVVGSIFIGKQLCKHQKEWNLRKANAIVNGESPLDAYCEYLEYLDVFDRHPLFGVGIPRF